MYFVLARHLKSDEWEVAIAEIETQQEAIDVVEYEIEEDSPERNWEYLIVEKTFK